MNGLPLVFLNQPPGVNGKRWKTAAYAAQL